MDLEAAKPNKVGAQARFTFQEFRKFHKAQGRVVVWEQAAECPCVRRTALSVSMGTSIPDATNGLGSTERARPDCEVCKGRGYLHHSPQEMQVTITSADGNPKRFEAWGENMLGMISVTCLPENLPGFLDRLTIQKSVMVLRDVRTRTGAAVEALRRPVVTRTLALAGGAASVGVLYAHKASVAGVATALDVLQVGVDFEVDADGRIDWTLGDASGRSPDEGGRYSISYYANPSYLVMNHPHIYRDAVDVWKRPAASYTESPMVVNAVCRLEFLG